MIGSMMLPRQGIGRVDVAIALGLSALGLLQMYGNVVDEQVQVSVLAMPLFLAVTVPVLWRRVAPIPAIAVSLGAWLVHVAIFGVVVVRCGTVLPLAFVYAFTCGAELEGRASRGGLLLASLLVVGEGVAYVGLFAVFFLGIAFAMWSVGRVVRSRRLMAVELDARSRELREARDERARLEVATDRARLSRELDALLQRRLGELGRMAEVGANGSEPTAAAATLVEIEHESRRTLEEMRGLVGALRSDSDDLAPTSPQPTLAHLEALLLRARGSGARLNVAGHPRVLPPGVELSAYRIVEHLLDAIDDAPDVDVRVGFEDDALEIAVAGRARRGAKASIERARERVTLQNGTLDATIRGGHARALASLPIATVG
jgi:signal transduction histidine kinase